MDQCRCITCNEFAVYDVDNGEGYACVRAGG